MWEKGRVSQVHYSCTGRCEYSRPTALAKSAEKKRGGTRDFFGAILGEYPGTRQETSARVLVTLLDLVWSVTFAINSN